MCLLARRWDVELGGRKILITQRPVLSGLFCILEMQSLVVINAVASKIHIPSQPLRGLHVIDGVMSKWKLLFSGWKRVCVDFWVADTPAVKLLQSIFLLSVRGISFSLTLSLFLSVVNSVCLPTFVRNRILKYSFLVCCSHTYKTTCTAAQRQNAHTVPCMQAHTASSQPNIKPCEYYEL